MVHYAFKCNLTHLAWFQTYFKWLFYKTPELRHWIWSSKSWMTEMHVFSLWKVLQDLWFILILSGRQTKPGIKTTILLKTIAMAVIFHMPPWLPMCLKWLRCYRSYRAEIFLVNLHLLSVLMSIIFILCQKYATNVHAR